MQFKKKRKGKEGKETCTELQDEHYRYTNYRHIQVLGIGN